ncbi:hypothetical protein TNCV_1491401 [Trichonephila clavipes]|nr:hypothetical protein TNCV_1491401 [Trichonephila clavipes]
MKKSAAEVHRMLSNTYSETAISERTCRSGFNASRKEAARAVGLSKSEDVINEVLDDAASVMNLTEKERKE